MIYLNTENNSIYVIWHLRILYKNKEQNETLPDKIHKYQVRRYLKILLCKICMKKE